MASIAKRGKAYKVQTRKNGISKCRSFSTKAEAKAWAKKIEELADDGLIAPTTITLAEALERYRDTGVASVYPDTSAGC